MFILLVDNNRFFVAVLQTMLLKAGFNCIACSENGLECIARVKRNESPDVIIIDETQCYIKGLDVVENIRNARPETKIIILTRIDSDLNVNLLPDSETIYFLDKSSITADNLPQLLYNIFTKKISLTRVPPANKVFSSLRRSFTGMLNF